MRKQVYYIRVEKYSTVDDLGGRLRFNDYTNIEHITQGLTAAIGDAVRMKREAGDLSCVIVYGPTGRGREITSGYLAGRRVQC